MTPEELAKYRADQLASAKTPREEGEVGKLAANARIDQQNADAEAALRSIIPHLDRIKAAIPSLEFAPLMDTSRKIAGINLRLGQAAANIEKSANGDISAVLAAFASTRQGPSRKPFASISSSADITPDNLNTLIKAMIDAE